MAWNSLGTISVNSGWQWFPPLPEEATVYRLAGGNSRAFAWVGLFKTTSTQEVLAISAFKAVGTWRVYNIPQAPYPLRVGVILPRPGPRYSDPLPFNLSCAVWIQPT